MQQPNLKRTAGEDLPHSRVQGRRWLKWIVAGMACLAVVHLVLGCSPTIVLLTLVIVLLGLLPIIRYGFFHIAGLLMFLISFRYVGFPLVGKLIVGQPLDSYLDLPVIAVAAVLLGFIGYLTAMILAVRIQVGKPWLRPPTEELELRLVSIVSGVVGLAANIALALRISEPYEGVTVANFFVPLLHLALISAVARVLIVSRGRQQIDSWVVLLIVLGLMFSFVRNSRMPIVEIFLGFTFTTAAFRGRLVWRQVLNMGFSVVAIVVFITPVMLYVRGYRDDLSWTQRVFFTVNAMSNWRVVLEEYAAKEAMQERKVDFLDYYGIQANVFIRMSYIKIVDSVISYMEGKSVLEYDDLRFGVEYVLPRVVVPNKAIWENQGDWLYCEIGIICRNGNYLTLPLIANGYIAFGWIGVFIYPLILGLSTLLPLKKATEYQLNKNIWAIYFFVRLQNVFVEGGSTAYLATVFRTLPQDIVVILIITIAVRLLVSHRQRRMQKWDACQLS